MSLKRLTGHHLRFVSLKGGCTGSLGSTLLKCYNVGNHVSQLILEFDSVKAAYYEHFSKIFIFFLNRLLK